MASSHASFLSLFLHSSPTLFFRHAYLSFDPDEEFVLVFRQTVGSRIGHTKKFPVCVNLPPGPAVCGGDV